MLLLISHGLSLLMTNFCFQNTKATDGLRLKKKMSHKLFGTTPRGELCAPSGAMVDLPVPLASFALAKQHMAIGRLRDIYWEAIKFECV